MAGAHGRLDHLRQLLAERFPHLPSTPEDHFQTGQSLLDTVLGDGLPKGAITEITSPGLSAGSASLIAALVRAAGKARYFMALIDGRDSFDPGPLGDGSLQHLLWVRCEKAIDAMKAADLLLRDGNFALVLLDLVLNSPNELQKIPQTNWYRLQRLVEPSSTTLVVFSRRNMVASARLKLVLQNQWTLGSLEQADALNFARLHVQRLHLPRSAKAG
jgi:hypothetical protein